jgi:hypothetical protein
LLSTSSEGAVVPVHDVTVSALPGASLTTYPAFDPDVDRYAVRSGQDVDGLSVTASSTDPQASISVNGRRVANGSPHAVQGLDPGDEVNVQITDAAGTSNQSWIVLPARFPDVGATGPHEDLAPGKVFLTLSSFLAPPFSAVVDERGVPAMVFNENASDFKKAHSDPDHYSIARPVQAGGYRITELDEQFEEVRSHRLTGDKASSTDFHDSTLFPDGSALLMGYDYLTRDGGVWTDAIIQRVDPAGEATFTWNSKDHVDEAEGLVDRTAHDYAHINSMQELPSGDVVASFRNLSQVMLIAGSDHDGHEQGDVIWRLGGLRNDFEFIDDPHAGPCAQHAAEFLPNGHLMIFDNGSRRDDGGPIAPQTADMCADPDDMDGPRIARPQSRVTEYALDTTTTPPTATLVWSHEPTGRYAPFAGNAQRLANGNTIVGWSQSEVPSGVRPVATEVTEAGEEIWSLTAGGGHFSYRAFKYDAPDRIVPEVTVTAPANGTTVEQGARLTLDIGCRDAGGSNLDICGTVDLRSGDLLPTEQPGTHEVVVRATDRAGNEATRSIRYTVTPAPVSAPSPTVTPSPTATPTPGPARADAAIRKSGGSWKGRDTYATRKQTVRLRALAGTTTRLHVRVANAGGTARRLTLSATSGGRQVTGRWYAGRRDVTPAVLAGTYRTPRLELGESMRLRLVVALGRGASGVRTLRLSAAAPGGTAPDVVRARLTIR